jgi:hypothetical protein
MPPPDGWAITLGPASGTLLCWSVENCTGSERDRPGRHVLMCRFGASLGEPQPINGSDEQMFGRKQQTPHGHQRDLSQ